MAEQKVMPADSAAWGLARPGQRLLRSGDLVFRHGRGIVSEMVLRFSLRDARYSHAGILSLEGDTAYVYHALGGEGSHTALRKETLESFCRPAGACAFGIYRLDLTTAQQHRLMAATHQAYRSKIPFDTRYDLRTDSAFYCTEFVYRMLQQATGDKKYIPLTQVAGFAYVSCDNLYQNRHAAFVYAHVYPE